MSPKVSIIVPIYNVEQYLDRCVQSLLHQTLHDIEIILVDDGSPDRCPQMCDEYARQDARIKVVHKKNEGLGYARNSGLEVATGEYVTFCDSDDFVDLEAYEYVLNVIQSRNLEICWFQPRRVDTKGGIVLDGTRTPEEYFNGKDEIRKLQLDIIGHNPQDKYSKPRGFSSCMALFRRETVISSGIRFPSEREVASEDLIFVVKLLPYVNSVGILSNIFYNYTINPCSISQNFSEEKYDRLINMLTEIRAYCNSSFDYKTYKSHYYSQVLRIFHVILKYISVGKLTFIQKCKRIRKECTHPMMLEFYNEVPISCYNWKEQLFVYCMKYKICLFFIIIYKFKR